MAAIVKQIGEIGRAAAELADGHRILRTRQFAEEEFRDEVFVKSLIEANADGIRCGRGSHGILDTFEQM